MKTPQPLKRIKTTRQEIFYQDCPYCHVEIRGNGVKGFRYNMDRHIQEKHSEEKGKKK